MIQHKLYTLLLSICACALLSSCAAQRSSSAQLYDPKEVSQLSRKLGIKIDNQSKEDDKNMALYAESSLWIGTPYRYGGQTKKGTDCSGFITQVYKKVYHKKLPRSTDQLDKMKQITVSKANLKTGDLVYFATTKNKKKISHVGIYLKDGKFVHASTSKGVIVSSISEQYYKQTWRKAGRVR